MAFDQGTCKGCGRAILWVRNSNGKPTPFDAKPTQVLRLKGDGSVALGQNEKLFAGDDSIADGRLNHFISCPQADNFRTKKAKPTSGKGKCSGCGCPIDAPKGLCGECSCEEDSE